MYIRRHAEAALVDDRTGTKSILVITFTEFIPFWSFSQKRRG